MTTRLTTEEKRRAFANIASHNCEGYGCGVYPEPCFNKRRIMKRQIIRHEIREALFQEWLRIEPTVPGAKLIEHADSMADAVMKKLEALDPTVLER